MKRALALATFAAGGCSFLCIPGGNCVSDGDCGTGYLCAPDSGVCIPGQRPPTASSATGTGTSGNPTSGSSSGFTTTTSGGSTSGLPRDCASGNVQCCGDQWAAQNASSCAEIPAPPAYTQLYASRTSVNQIVQIDLTGTSDTTIADISALQQNAGIAAIAPGPSGAFFFFLDTGGTGIGFVQPGQQPEVLGSFEEYEPGSGLAFFPTTSTLVVATFGGIFAFSFSNGALAQTPSWSQEGPAAAGWTGYQLQALGSAGVLAGASPVLATLLDGAGDVCETLGCYPMTGNSAFFGVAEGPDGSRYYVGEDGNEGGAIAYVQTVGGADSCQWLRVSDSSACTLTGLNCPCQADPSLESQPLNQAALVNGTLYVTEGGPFQPGNLATYSPGNLGSSATLNTYRSGANGLTGDYQALLGAP